MRRIPNESVATLVLLVMLMSLGGSGCGQPVREDRSINWSQEGQGVGFQHGKEGVFLADQQGNKLRKIFQPGDGVLATSTPLWSPDGQKVIFTTARNAGNDPVPFQVLPNVDDPAGNVYLKRPIVYTCWLHEETGQSPAREPVALFEAACDHAGYVAANLAVRWHPRKQSLYYIQTAGADQHGLFEFDLTTRQSQQVFAHTAEALIFDWTPDGSRLVCVLGNTQPKPDSDGIWIGQPDSRDWWHVPQSESLTEGELPSLLERARATRPAWTADSGKFAFASSIPGKTQEQPGRFFLWLGTMAARQVKSLAEGAEPFRDLRWAADGVRLGLVKGKENGSLHLLGP